jgi:hypothetical protein
MITSAASPERCPNETNCSMVCAVSLNWCVSGSASNEEEVACAAIVTWFL